MNEDTGVTPITSVDAALESSGVHKEGYIHRVFVALDIFLNVIFNGREDETMSSRIGRAAIEGKWWAIILTKFLNVFEKDHVAISVCADIGRAEDILNTEEKSGIIEK